MEDKICCGDGDHFFEDAADAEGYNGRALKECELGCCHQEGQSSGKNQDKYPNEDTLSFTQRFETAAQWAKPFDWDSDNGKTDKHDWREKENAAEWIARCWIPEQQDLSEGPAKAGEESGGDNEDKANDIEGYFAGYHHDHP